MQYRNPDETEATKSHTKSEIRMHDWDTYVRKTETARKFNEKGQLSSATKMRKSGVSCLSNLRTFKQINVVSHMSIDLQLHGHQPSAMPTGKIFKKSQLTCKMSVAAFSSKFRPARCSWQRLEHRSKK